MSPMTTLKCPKCGSTENLATERRPFGDTKCGKCGNSTKTSTYMVMANLKCPNCKSQNVSPEYYGSADSAGLLVRNCHACHHENSSELFGSSETKRDQAVASNSEVQLAHVTLERDGLRRQIEAATVANQKREREIIGLKQEVSGLKTCIAKLKAIRKELRNIIELQREV